MTAKRRTKPARIKARASALRRKPSAAKKAPTKPPPPEEQLYERIADILEHARGQVSRTVNTAMVNAYWLVGREIVEVEQHGSERATYGEAVIGQLAVRLQGRFGKGFSAQNLRRMRQFSLAFPHGSKLRSGSLSELNGPAERIRSGSLSKSDGSRFPASLGWTHYLVLLRIVNPDARAFYEIEAARERWSVPQLERQIQSLLFERLSRSRKPEEVLALARDGQEVAKPSDVIKDPFVLEFLDVREHPGLHEREIEQAIIDRLESFLLEMGKGFCFVGRQVRLTIEGDHFYVDLVFYNRLLRCFVLVDLKLGKLTHQDLGQMLMYVNYYDHTQRAEHEAKTVGIVLCSQKNDTMVRITFPDNDQVLAATYKRYLPTEAELSAELSRERQEAERMLRLTAPAANNTDTETKAGGEP
ncbi:MAG: PDDEXK nuclease domain-containing protein [Myxococcota bacterium]|nr:PDDEXK nuclease domain-containing protein [Myxococcota bacterium]